jgi:hypothetical protein
MVRQAAARAMKKTRYQVIAQSLVGPRRLTRIVHAINRTEALRFANKTLDQARYYVTSIKPLSSSNPY